MGEFKKRFDKLTKIPDVYTFRTPLLFQFNEEDFNKLIEEMKQDFPQPETELDWLYHTGKIKQQIEDWFMKWFGED